MMASEQVNHPQHYGGEGSPYETIKVLAVWMTTDELRGFCLGNALKYLSRAGKKGDRLEDLKKARWYLDHLITTENKPNAEDAIRAALIDRDNARAHADELSGLVDALADRCGRLSHLLTASIEHYQSFKWLLQEIIKRTDPCLIAPDGWCDTHQGCPCVVRRAKEYLGVVERLETGQVG